MSGCCRQGNDRKASVFNWSYLQGTPGPETLPSLGWSATLYAYSRCWRVTSSMYSRMASSFDLPFSAAHASYFALASKLNQPPGLHRGRTTNEKVSR